MYIDWLKTRRDIAEENLEIQLKQMVNAKALADQMDALGSLLGNIADLEGTKDKEELRLLEIYKKKLIEVTEDIGLAVDKVEEEANELGIQPAQIDALKQANKFLADVESRKFTESEWLEKIHEILQTMDGKLTTISEALPEIKPKNPLGEDDALSNLSKETTQTKVLETLEGYFVNQ